MLKSSIFKGLPLLLLASIMPLFSLAYSQEESDESEVQLPKRAYAILAGGCFWCVESDFEKLPGVVEVISGYSGGRTAQPTYQNYASGGHREVVSVIYDPSEITFGGLVEYLVKHIDPTDRRGQFKDRGMQYAPAVYYKTDDEKLVAQRVIRAINGMKIFRGKKVDISVLPEKAFWVAEQKHQDYYKKNPADYMSYRVASGRQAFINQAWGLRAKKLELPGARPEGATSAGEVTKANASSNETLVSSETPQAKPEKPWLQFRKPSMLEMKRKLTPIQFKVTQQDGTEPAFKNPYWDNKKDGIYVDVLSGAPLFSSVDKFKSGTGWPSFVKPISPDAVVFKTDYKMFIPRTEVRSRYGNSHLGHVFSDGPRNRGGKRYCMNSASLRFIPKEKLSEEGYEDFLVLFEK